MTNHGSIRRLLLFDVDGTLILSGGRGSKAMKAAAQAMFQRPFTMEFRDFAGNTDRAIIRTMLLKHDISPPDFEETIDKLLENYLVHLARLLEEDHPVKVLPGVWELLEALWQDGRFGLGLVTGNIEAGARLKLEPPGLNRFFPIGAFGSDHIDRNQLPPLAIKKAEQHYRQPIAPEQVWIIGDTPRDIECAKANRLHSLAVATGGWTLEDLRRHHPDVLLTDLSDTQRVIEILSR